MATLHLNTFATRNTVRTFVRTPMGFVAAVQQPRAKHGGLTAVQVWAMPARVEYRKSRNVKGA